jgi:iron complex transport system substrate-binding protein
MSRIVSFLPSSTEILYEIGIGNQVVGVIHECKFPDDAKIKPRIISSSFEAAKLTSAEIDKKIVELARSGGAIYLIDDEKLRKSTPDLIVTQGVCEVCAPFTKEIEHAVSTLGYRPEILVLDPHDLDDILVSIMDIAERVGKITRGRELVVTLQKRIDYIMEKSEAIEGTNNQMQTAKVLCIEWIDPLYSAGHWIPQMVEIAGGVNGISSRGSPSRRISMDEIARFRPDKIILMPCGFDLNRALLESKILKNNNEWTDLQAVSENEVYAVNATAYFSKPGPRTVTGLEILAIIINPAKYADLVVPSNSFERITSAK